MIETCALCDLYERRISFTKIYGEYPDCIVIESFNKDGTRKRLMAVLKKHTITPTEAQKKAVLDALVLEANKIKAPYSIEEYHSDIGHFHLHARFA